MYLTGASSLLLSYAGGRAMSGLSGLNSRGGRGAFILFEGIDRCGKSTQVRLLTEYLKGQTVCEDIRFPDRTSYIGKLINDYLANAASTSGISDQTIHLLFSANRWEASKLIEEKLMEGTTFVCDRYAYSGVSFSAAKGTAGMDLDWCKAPDRGLLSPDCIIYLDMPVEDAAKRGDFGQERYEKIDFQLRVREQFMALKAEDGARSGGVPWHTIDASQSIETIRDAIRIIADKTVEESRGKAIGRLW
jgi:dTMP kinase